MDCSLVENFRSFHRSRVPRRIMYFCKDTGRWRDFPVELSTILAKCFSEKKTSVLIPTLILQEGKVVFSSSNMSIIEFLRMKQTDLTTGDERGIAWVDVDGERFFPRHVVDAGVKSFEEHSDESSSSEIRNRTEVRRNDERYYQIVEKLFLSETTKVVPPARLTVTSIKRCNFSGASDKEARRRVFSTKVEDDKSGGGNANIRFGWYVPSSTYDMDVILRRGFVSFRNSSGFGIHLLRSEFLRKMASNNKVDDVEDRDRERHVLLCRVITNPIAKANANSTDSQPSGDKTCESVVDDVDVEQSRHGVIWTNDTHTLVIPECIVSYKYEPKSKSTSHMLSRKKKSSVNNYLSFSQLFAEIETSLPPTSKLTLDILFDRYKAKKIEKKEFIRQIRSIAGNKLLMNVIKKIRRWN